MKVKITCGLRHVRRVLCSKRRHSHFGVYIRERIPRAKMSNVGAKDTVIMRGVRVIFLLVVIVG